MKKQEILNNVLPCLKPQEWIGQQHTFCHPLLEGLAEGSIPWVGYGLDAPHSFRFLDPKTVEELGFDLDPSNQLVRAATSNLVSREAKIETSHVQIKSKACRVIYCRKDFFSAEKIMDRDHMTRIHQELDSDDLIVGIPRRGLMICASRSEPKQLLWELGLIVAHEYHTTTSAQISPNPFVLQKGIPVGIMAGEYEEAAQVFIDASKKKMQENKPVDVNSLLMKDKQTDEMIMVIAAAGVDFDLMTSQVINHYMQAISEAQNHSLFSGRVEVWIVPEQTPSNDRERIFRSDIKMHLEAIAEEQGFAELLGVPIKVNVQRKSVPDL